MMRQRSEPLRDLALADVRAHPELITDLLLSETDVSLVLERHGDTVRVAAMRTYDQELRDLLEEGREQYREKKQRGYSREEAFTDLEAVQEELETSGT